MGTDVERIESDAQIARKREAPEEQWVYFLEAEGTDLVKIGYATNAARRLSGHAAACPVPLKVLGTTLGGRSKEAEFHELLSDYRHHGEWFRKSPFLETIVAALDRPPALVAAVERRQEYLMAYLEKNFQKPPKPTPTRG